MDKKTNTDAKAAIDDSSGTPLTPFTPTGAAATGTQRAAFHPDVPGRHSIPGAIGSTNNRQAAPETIEPNRLIIGREIKLKGGEISACDRLSLDGEVDNVNLARARLLEVSPEGVFKGKAHVDEAVIGGHFEGELTVSTRLTIEDGGSISGSVKYGSIVIQPGGSISGDMQTITDASDT